MKKNRDGFYGSGSFRENNREVFPAFDSRFLSVRVASGPSSVEVTVGTLAIRYQDPRKLKPRAKNPRTHTPRQIKQIAVSIQEFGFINPVLVDGSDGIVAGHARVEAAISVGMTDVPTVRGRSPPLPRSAHT